MRMAEITMGEPELVRLHQAAVDARKLYEEKVSERLRPILNDLFEGAEFKIGVQANSDTRKPWVRITIRRPPFSGRTVEIDACGFLKDRFAVVNDAFDSMRSELRSVNVLESDFCFKMFSPQGQFIARSPWPPKSVVDEIERHAVMAVMRDLELRIRKMPDRTWLLDLKRAIDAAIVKDVQEG